MTLYTGEFFQEMSRAARSSAQVVVPIVMRLVCPRSVIDIGCGTGTWLAVFRDHGIKNVTGVDGDYVDRQRLEIPPHQFLAHDLTQPLNLDAHFDLVISLEVAEHLPEEVAPSLIETLTRLGPVVLFSAAIPFQGGTNHVNEQWPEYWAKLFDAHGYLHVDCIRELIWHDSKVEWYYAQNILLFVRDTFLTQLPHLKAECDRSHHKSLSVVHPQCYLNTIHHRRRSYLEARSRAIVKSLLSRIGLRYR